MEFAHKGKRAAIRCRPLTLLYIATVCWLLVATLRFAQHRNARILYIALLPSTSLGYGSRGAILNSPRRPGPPPTLIVLCDAHGEPGIYLLAHPTNGRLRLRANSARNQWP